MIAFKLLLYTCF